MPEVFLNGLLLAGLGAVVLPIVLHLLNRARGRSVAWGAMLFLADPSGAERSSRRWRQHGVLALRVGAILLLALAFARPQLPGMPPRALANTTALVIVIDGSPSMTHPELTTMRFELARRAAAADLAQLRHGDQAALIELGGPSWDMPLTGDLQAVASRLASLAPLSAGANLADGVRRAGALLRTAEGASRVIHLIADRQRSAWNDLPHLPVDWARGARIVATPVGSTGNENISVDSIDLTGPAPVVGCPADVTVRLRNWSDVPVRNLHLRLGDGRRDFSQTLIDLGPRAAVSIDRAFTPTRAGSLVLTARIDPSGISTDDRASLACDVLPPVRVLLIGPDAATTRPATQPALGPTDYARLALTARSSAGASTGPSFDVKVAAWRDDPDPAQSAAQVILLADALPATVEQAQMLQNFVLTGGGLLIAPGPRATTDAWDLLSDYGPWPLPGLEPKATGRAGVKQPEDAAKVFGPTADAFADVSIQAWRPLTLYGNQTVVSRLTNGDPFAVASDCGDGRVLTLAGPLDASWSNFPRTTAFLPALQNAVRYLAGDRPTRRNVAMGTPLDVTIDRPADRFVTLWRPDGRVDRQTLLMNGSQGVVHYTATDVPGRYVLVAKGQANLDFVVRANPAESDLSLLDDAMLDPLLKPSSVARMPADPGRFFARPLSAQPMELAPALLALAAGCLVLDAWLATRIGPKPAGAT